MSKEVLQQALEALMSYSNSPYVSQQHPKRYKAGNAAIEALRTELAKLQAQPTLPDGWVPLVITHDGQHPEEVAYGPKRMMDRLGKWLTKYFESKAQPQAQPEPVTWPKNAAEVREFFRVDYGSRDCTREDLTPDDDDKYLISAHDFLSAVDLWADYPHFPADYPNHTAPQPPAAEPARIEMHIDFKQSTALLGMFCGEPGEVTLTRGDGHSGPGLYAYYTDMPEEGAVYLGIADDEAVPEPPIAQPSAAEPLLQSHRSCSTCKHDVLNHDRGPCRSCSFLAKWEPK